MIRDNRLARVGMNESESFSKGILIVSGAVTIGPFLFYTGRFHQSFRKNENIFGLFSAGVQLSPTGPHSAPVGFLNLSPLPVNHPAENSNDECAQHCGPGPFTCHSVCGEANVTQVRTAFRDHNASLLHGGLDLGGERFEGSAEFEGFCFEFC